MKSTNVKHTKPRPRGGKEKMKSPLPMKHGVSASRVWLPKLSDENSGEWKTILDFLLDEFPFLSEEIFKERMSHVDLYNELIT